MSATHSKPFGGHEYDLISFDELDPLPGEIGFVDRFRIIESPPLELRAKLSYKRTTQLPQQRVFFRRSLISLAVEAAFIPEYERHRLYANPFQFTGIVERW